MVTCLFIIKFRPSLPGLVRTGVLLVCRVGAVSFFRTFSTAARASMLNREAALNIWSPMSSSLSETRESLRRKSRDMPDFWRFFPPCPPIKIILVPPRRNFLGFNGISAFLPESAWLTKAVDRDKEVSSRAANVSLCIVVRIFCKRMTRGRSCSPDLSF